MGTVAQRTHRISARTDRGMMRPPRLPVGTTGG
jgi:hypothetical protein